MVLLPVTLMASRVRRLLLAGFKRRDLVDAIEAELSRRREEIAFLYGAGPSRLERVLRRTAYGAALVAGTVVWLAVRTPALVPVGLFRLSTPAAAGVALLAAVVARWRTEHRTDPKRERRLQGGPEGFVYVAAGSPLITVNSVLVSEWSARRISLYETDDGGNPKLDTAQDFITGLSGAEGAYRDPATGDFFFSTWGMAMGDRVIAVRGFTPIIN